MSCKALYRVRNWRIYNQSLIDRGNITFWFAPEAIKGWQSAKKHALAAVGLNYSTAPITCSKQLSPLSNVV
jgi:hypothetical protein